LRGSYSDIRLALARIKQGIFAYFLFEYREYNVVASRSGVDARLVGFGLLLAWRRPRENRLNPFV